MNREGIYGVSKDKTSIHDGFFCLPALSLLTFTDWGLQIKHYSFGTPTYCHLNTRLTYQLSFDP